MLRCLVILCVAGAVLGGSPPTMPPQAQPAHADSGNEAHTGTYATSYEHRGQEPFANKQLSVHDIGREHDVQGIAVGQNIKNVDKNGGSEPFKTASSRGGGIGVVETDISHTPDKPAYWYRGFDGVERGCTPGMHRALHNPFLERLIDVGHEPIVNEKLRKLADGLMRGTSFLPPTWPPELDAGAEPEEGGVSN